MFSRLFLRRASIIASENCVSEGNARREEKKGIHPSIRSCWGFFIIHQPLRWCSAEVSPPIEESLPPWGYRDGNGDDGEAGLTVFSPSCFKLAIMWQKKGIISSRLRFDSRDWLCRCGHVWEFVCRCVSYSCRSSTESKSWFECGNVFFSYDYFWARRRKKHFCAKPSHKHDIRAGVEACALAMRDLLCPRMLPPPSHTPVLPTQTHTCTHTLSSHRPGCQSYTNSHPLAAGFQDNHGNQSLTPGETSSRSERLHSISTSQYSTHKRTHMRIFFVFFFFSLFTH